MASEIKGEVVLAETSVTMGITGGPNDWDLWLCLRGTHNRVCFDLNRAIKIPPFGDYTTFFNGTVTAISRPNFTYSPGEHWEIKGKVCKGNLNTNFTYEATYNIQTRKGSITFSYKYPKYKET